MIRGLVTVLTDWLLKLSGTQQAKLIEIFQTQFTQCFLESVVEIDNKYSIWWLNRMSIVISGLMGNMDLLFYSNQFFDKVIVPLVHDSTHLAHEFAILMLHRLFDSENGYVFDEHVEMGTMAQVSLAIHSQTHCEHHISPVIHENVSHHTLLHRLFFLDVFLGCLKGTFNQMSALDAMDLNLVQSLVHHIHSCEDIDVATSLLALIVLPLNPKSMDSVYADEDLCYDGVRCLFQQWLNFPPPMESWVISKVESSLSLILQSQPELLIDLFNAYHIPHVVKAIHAQSSFTFGPVYQPLFQNWFDKKVYTRALGCRPNARDFEMGSWRCIFIIYTKCSNFISTYSC